jgi:DNA-binding NtrC family response regulator
MWYENCKCNCQEIDGWDGYMQILETRLMLDEPILVVNADKEQCRALCDSLQSENYRTFSYHSVQNLEKKILEIECRIIILDLDSLPVDNRFIVDLRRRYPKLPIIGLSSRPFHPDLREAMSTHIFACMIKPLDLDELIFWIKSISEKE